MRVRRGRPPLGHQALPKELGLRIAAGAAPGAVRRLGSTEGSSPVLAGLALGVAASLAVNGVRESQLVGVSPSGPLALAAAPPILVFAALLGCPLPARGAVRVDPATALRGE